MTILEEIVEVKKEEVKMLHRDFTLSRFSDSAYFDMSTLSLYDNISGKDNISIIAEVKKASPSKGIIRENFNPTDTAMQYMEAGANAISVLTDVNFFHGSINYLKQIAEFRTVPLLRKDFIIDEYQVYEAKANGADAILLICEILSEAQVKELSHAAEELNLDILLELHSIEQLPKVNPDLNNIVGINNRDLKTFKVDINNSIEIAKLLHENIAVVAESGFADKKDIDKVKGERIDALLIGEHFMRAEKIYDEVTKFKEWCNREG